MHKKIKGGGAPEKETVTAVVNPYKIPTFVYAHGLSPSELDEFVVMFVDMRAMQANAGMSNDDLAHHILDNFF